MKPTDLDDPTPLEPDADLLARVHARSRSFPRRRSAQRVASVAIGVLVVGLAGGFALSHVDSGGGHGRVRGPVPTATSTTPPTTTTTLPEGAVSVHELVGPWQPDTVAGYVGSLPSGPVLFSELRFDAAGGWAGSDGCNEITGTYRIGSSGAFTFAVVGSTDVGCTEGFPPVPGSLVAATRVELVKGRLSFFASNGRAIAQYVRQNVFARLDLPSTTITAGSSIRATVVVENDTGRVIHALRCGDYFQAVLGNAQVHQDGLWQQCAQNFEIPIGASSYPVRVSTTYLGCTNGTASTADPVCLPNGRPPRLPPGEYQATLEQNGSAVPNAPSITVRVVAAQ